MSTDELCETVHGILLQLPLYDHPSKVLLTDGWYFFYETSETRHHAPDGRVVRFGKHLAVRNFAAAPETTLWGQEKQKRS